MSCVGIVSGLRRTGVRCRRVGPSRRLCFDSGLGRTRVGQAWDQKYLPDVNQVRIRNACTRDVGNIAAIVVPPDAGPFLAGAQRARGDAPEVVTFDNDVSFTQHAQNSWLEVKCIRELLGA